MISPSVHGQGESHAGLLDYSGTASARARFDVIVVPTHRPVKRLRASIDLARRTGLPLIVMCSRAIRHDEAIIEANEAGIEAFAFDMPAGNPLAIDFTTSVDAELAAASPDRNSDLSMKRNIGLVLARLLRWDRMMFLDDDIYWVGQRQVTTLAAALDDHKVSALIPKRGFPGNSVVCHARRLGGGKQDVFASASGIGVRCGHDLAFFPKVYNEDWFFFADEAARHRIKPVGESHQRKYDPYDSPARATWEEFGDLLAEGLYARLDFGEGIWDVDASYWDYFIELRRSLHQQIAESLTRVKHERRGEGIKAAESIRAAQEQLERITSGLCMKFMRSWAEDLEKMVRLPGRPAAARHGRRSLRLPEHPPGSRSESIIARLAAQHPSTRRVCRTGDDWDYGYSSTSASRPSSTESRCCCMALAAGLGLACIQRDWRRSSSRLR